MSWEINPETHCWFGFSIFSPHWLCLRRLQWQHLEPWISSLNHRGWREGFRGEQHLLGGAAATDWCRYRESYNDWPNGCITDCYHKRPIIIRLSVEHKGCLTLCFYVLGICSSKKKSAKWPKTQITCSYSRPCCCLGDPATVALPNVSSNRGSSNICQLWVRQVSKHECVAQYFKLSSIK